MLILILSYLRANELTIAVNHCNGPNQGKIEIIIGSKQSIFLNLSQLTSVNLLSSFITTPKKLIQKQVIQTGSYAKTNLHREQSMLHRDSNY